MCENSQIIIDKLNKRRKSKLFLFALLILSLLTTNYLSYAAENEPVPVDPDNSVSSDLLKPPIPGQLPPEIEEARARAAMEIVLAKYMDTLGTDHRGELGEVHVEGEWAYAQAIWQSEKTTTDGPIHILAHQLPDYSWQALLPSTDGLYLEWLNVVPDELISTNEKIDIHSLANLSDGSNNDKFYPEWQNAEVEQPWIEQDNYSLDLSGAASRDSQLEKSDYVTYHDPEYGFSFEHPSDWVTKGGKLVDEYYGIWEVRISDPMRYLSLIVSVQPVEKNIQTTKMWVDQILESGEYDVGSKRYTEHLTELTVANQPAVQVEYIYDDSNKVAYTYVYSDGYGYTIVLDEGVEAIGGSENLPDAIRHADAQIISRVLNSFALGNPSSGSNQRRVLVVEATSTADSFRHPLDGGWVMLGFKSRVYFSTSWCGNDVTLYHAAEDWGGSAGTQVKAVANGVVAWYDPNRSTYPGRVVIIRHDVYDGTTIYSMYAHLETVTVTQGQSVNKGDLVGTVMSWPGNSSNSHIHWEMRNFLDGRTVCGHPHQAGPGYTYQPPENYGYTHPTNYVNTHQGGGSTCTAPSLIEPANDAVLANSSITFRWNSVNCSHDGYTFRVCTSPDVDNLGNCFIDTGEGGTQRTETITGHDNQDLYWGVRTANPFGPWAVRHFRIDPNTDPEHPVMLYPDANYSGGWCALGGEGWANICDGYNDASSSIRLQSGWSARVWEHGNMEGGNKCYTSNDSDFSNDTFDNGVSVNDKVSSFAAYHQTNCPPLITPPGTPSLLSPSSGTTFNEGDNITLSWNNVANASEYFAEFWGGPAGTLNSGWQGGTSWNIGSQWAGNTYSWHVKSRNAAGSSGWSSTWNFNVRPAAPSGLSGQAASCSAINLNWTDNSGNEAGYKIYRNGTYVGQVGSDITSYQDTGLSEDTTYSYYVKAYRNDIQSAASNTVQITTQTCTPDDNESPTVDWVAPVGNGETYAVYGENVQFEFNATDNVAIDHVSVYTEFGDYADYNSPYQIGFDTSVLNSGLNIIYAQAFDTSGNSSSLSQRQIYLDLVDCNDPHEQNDTIGEATPINSYGATIAATICGPGDVDYYSFSGNADDKVVVDIDARVNGSDLDSYIYLLDSNGTTVLAENDDADSLDSKLGYQLGSNGTYFIKVRSYSHPNTGGDSYFYSVRVYTDDNAPATASITSPISGALLDPSWELISADASDNESGVKRVEFWWHDSDWINKQWEWLGDDYYGSDSWSYDLYTGDLSEQDNGTVYIRAYDYAGNYDGEGAGGLKLDRPTATWSSDYGYSNGNGWRVDKHVRETADVDADGMADIIGFGGSAVFVSYSYGSGFGTPYNWIDDYSYLKGWRTDKHVRTMADVNGDNMADIVGFGANGVFVSLSNGSSFGTPAKWSTEFGYLKGWRVEKHLRKLADVNGDGQDDIVGFGANGVFVALSTGSNFNAPTKWSSEFGYLKGWTVNRMPREVADVNGDGKADIVGFGGSGTFVGLSSGSSFGAPVKWIGDFGYNHGWRTDRDVRELADVNGDGKLDLVGFGDLYVYTAVSNGSSFTGKLRWTEEFTYNDTWRVEYFPRMLADHNGDGREDIAGFGNNGVYVLLSDRYQSASASSTNGIRLGREGK